MPTSIPHNTPLVRSLRTHVDWLTITRWTHHDHDVPTITAAVAAGDNATFARLVTASRNGDRDAGTVAIWALLPEIAYDVNVRRRTRPNERADALDDTISWVTIAITDPTTPADELTITKALDRGRHRARRHANPYRPDRPLQTRVEFATDSDILQLLASTGADCVERTVIARDELRRTIAAAHRAIATGALNPATWTMLLNHSLHDVPSAQLDPTLRPTTARTRIHNARATLARQLAA